MSGSGAYGLYKTAGMLFIAAGIIFCVIGAGGYASQVMVRRTMNAANAVVTAIYPEGTQVEYSVEGQQYVAVLNYSSDMLHLGDVIRVFYPEGHPEDPRLGESVVFLAFLFLGAVFLAAGTLSWRRWANMEKRRKYLMQNGHKLYARIADVKYDFRYKRGYTYARRLVCQHEMPEGEILTFISDPAWTDSWEGLIGNEVAVYVERGNYGNYYVDLSFLASSAEINIH